MGYSGFVVGNSDFPTIERRGAIPSHGILSERSSPSRVRFAAKNAPLTAPGRSEDLSVTKEWEISGTAALHVAGPMSPGYPLKTQKSRKKRQVAIAAAVVFNVQNR